MSDDGTSQQSLEHHGNEVHLIREIIRVYQALITGFASETGMPSARFGLMRALALSDGTLGVSDLARRLGVNQAAVTRQIKMMVAEGLVLRKPDPNDQRRSRLALSPDGAALFESVHRRAHDLEHSLEAELGADSITQAAELLVKLRQSLESRR